MRSVLFGWIIIMVFVLLQMISEDEFDIELFIGVGILMAICSLVYYYGNKIQRTISEFKCSQKIRRNI